MLEKKRKYILFILVVLILIGIFYIYKNVDTKVDKVEKGKAEINTDVKANGIKLDTNSLILEYDSSSKLTVMLFPNDVTINDIEWISSAPSLVTVDKEGNITVVGEKEETVTITVKTKDGKHSASAKVKVIKPEVKVTGIKLDTEEMTLEYNTSGKLTAMILPNDVENKGVEWISSAPNLVTVDNNGNIKVVENKDGIVTITVKTKDGKHSASAKIKVIKVKVEVEVTEIKIDKTSITLGYGKTSKLTATISPNNATNKEIEWISSDPSLVTVDNNGNIKAIGNKNAVATITVMTSDGKHSASAKVKVEGIKPTGIKLDKSSVTLKYGTTDTIKATVIPNNAANKKVTWTSSNPNLVTVDNNGNIKAILNQSGSVTITAKTSDGKHSISINVKVVKVEIKVNVTGIKLDKKTVTLKYGTTDTIKATISPSNATNKNVNWTSSNSNLVTVDSNGNIEAVGNKNGTATITAKTAEGNYSASVKVKVTSIKAATINLNKTSVTLQYGKTTKLTSTISPSNTANKKVTWTSSDTSLVTVDSSGNIKAVGNKDGTATITVKTNNGKTAKCTVKVTAIKVTGVKLDKTSVTLQYGKTTKLTPTITPSNAANKKVTWTSSNTSLVTVDSSGNIKAVGNKDGTATITVKTNNGKTAKCTVKVTAIKVTGVKLDKTSVTLQYGKTTKLTPTITPSNAANKKVTWTSSNTSLVTVDSSGNIKAVGNKDGTATITVKTSDGGYTASSKITVKKINVSGVKLDKTTVTLTNEKAIKLTATVSPSNAANKKVIWSSSDTSLVTVDSNGNVKAVGSKNGTATITVKTSDEGKVATCKVTVKRKNYTVTFDSVGGTSVSKKSVLEGNKVSKPTNPTKKGYIFNGWLLSGKKYDFNTLVRSNISLKASWGTDFKAVDYCNELTDESAKTTLEWQTNDKRKLSLRPCIKNFKLPNYNTKIMQNFSITKNYIYFSSPFNGAWLNKQYLETTYLNGQTISKSAIQSKYSKIIDDTKFESISSVFITRIAKSSGVSKLNEIKYSGHGQGFDTISGDTDTLYLTAVASPAYNNTFGIGAFSNGVSYTSFKENGKIRVPGVSIVFNLNGGIDSRILSSDKSFIKNNVFQSNLYYDKIKSYAKKGSLGIASLAVDEKQDRLAYSTHEYANKIFIHKLSDVKKGVSSPTKILEVNAGQGIELYGNYLYIVTNSGTKIGLQKYEISTGKLKSSVLIDVATLYNGRESIEAEGISIYNGKIYIGIVSRKDKLAYNDIYLVEKF